MHSKTIKRLGFAALTDVRGRPSIADLIPPSKRKPGVYLLEFENGSFYLGQAVDPVRRFAQHRMNVGGIVGYSFSACRRQELDEIEQATIRKAEARGLPLTNRVHVSHIEGETDLDLIVSRESQDGWLAGERGSRRSPRLVRIPADSPARVRTKQRFEKLSNDDRYAEVLKCLGTYVGCAIMYPRSTQLTFWSVSCLPSTGNATFRRYSAVNAGMMELCVVGYSGNDVKRTWGFINVSRSILVKKHGNMQRVRATYRGALIDSSRAYRAAGQDQLRMETRSITDLTALLSHPAVALAARDLALRVMQSRATIYSQYHCPDLADAILR